MEDLFGNETPVIEPKRGRESMRALCVRFAEYRPAERGALQKCGNCANLFIKKYDSTYYKCRLFGLSNSPATDIRVRHVCRFHKPDQP